MERAVQIAKRPSKHSVSRAPEATVAQMLCDNEAVARQACKPGMQTFDQLVPAYRMAPLQGPDHDDGDPETRSCLLHKGRKLLQRDQPAAVKLVRDFVSEEEPHAWMAADVSGPQLRLYTAAQLGSYAIIQSAAHSRSTRVTCYVLIHREARSGRTIVHVARVEHFLRVTQPAAAGAPTLRLAVCKVFKEQLQRVGMYVARLNEVWRERWAVEMDALGAPLLTAVPPAGGVLYGMRYYNRSRMA